MRLSEGSTFSLLWKQPVSWLVEKPTPLIRAGKSLCIRIELHSWRISLGIQHGHTEGLFYRLLHSTVSSGTTFSVKRGIVWEQREHLDSTGAYFRKLSTYSSIARPVWTEAILSENNEKCDIQMWQKQTNKTKSFLSRPTLHFDLPNILIHWAKNHSYFFN